MKSTNRNKILLVGPYNPRKCGVASHIIQLASSLKKDGWIVDILSPYDCEGTYHENLIGGFNFLKLKKYVGNYDIVNVHFTPEEYFFMGRTIKQISNYFSLFAFYIMSKITTNINYIIHEPPPTRYFFQRTFLHKFAWSHVSHITFFTDREKQIFENKFQIRFNLGKYSIENVSRYFQIFSSLSQEEARHKLNIDHNKTIFLCIGFIDENKGFDRIASIFEEEKILGSELFIVGSVRSIDDNRSKEYLNKLSKNIELIDNVFLKNQYLDYSDFDTWIIASDYVVLPYRTISNSGVLGRAKLLKKKVIVSDVGGMIDQIDHDDFVFHDDSMLKKIIIDINESISNSTNN